MLKKILLTVLFTSWITLQLNSQCFSPPNYCTPTVTNINSYGIGLQNVTLGSTINNSTTATGLAPNYFNFTSMAVSGAANSTINFSIQNGGSNTTGARIFIDYDQNGTFSTSSPELVWTSSNTSPGVTVTGSFTIPSGQNPGVYRIRVTGDLGGQGANPCNLGYGEIEDYTLIVTSSTTDGQVISNHLPTKYVLGNNTIGITMANYTNSSISSMKIGYQLGSNTPVEQSLTGLSVAAGSIYSTTFSNQLNIGSTGTYTIKVWIDSINGAANNSTNNDTLCRTFVVCAGLSGTYTINPSGSGSSNFKRFGEADSALINCGVSGKVTFNVASGTYNEQIIIPNSISGLSASNNVTFQSATGNASDVNLTFSANTTNNFTLRLDGATFIRFKDMTITASNTNFGTALSILNNSNNDSFINVTFNGISTTSTSQNLAVINSPSNAIFHYLYFGNCRVNNGSYGTFLQSSSSSILGASSQNLTFFNCEFKNQYAYGMYNQYLDGLKFIYNKITTNSTYTAYTGIYNYWIMILDDTKRPIIYGNTISGAVGGTGMYNQYFGVNSTINALRKPQIFNNMIQIGTSANSTYGLRVANDYGSDFIHNTINITTTQNTSSSAAAFFESISSNTSNVTNNIFSSTTGAPAIRITTITNYNPVNFNDLYTSGTNLAYLNTTAYTTIAAWRTASGRDANSVNVNPGYVSSSDLHISGGPILLVPLNNSILTDIDGQTRCSLTDIGADFHPLTNDIGISRVIHPNNGIAGSGNRDIIVVLRNFGTNTVTSANVSYRDASTVKTIAWTGSLGLCDSAIVTFTGSNQYNFTGNWSLKFFTSAPNGTTDSYIPNDTLRMNGCVGLAGNYTINPSGSGSTNFTTFAAAISAMQSCGIATPVRFIVSASTYSEQISIPAINGTSTTNTITFDGGNGNASTRILTFSSTSASLPYVLRFSNCNNVIFRNMTIQAPSTTDAWPVHFLDGFNNRVSNCVIEISGSGASATASNLIPVVINGNATSVSTASTIANNHSVDSNTINAGYYNMYITLNNTNNIINVFNNSFNQGYQYGVYFVNPFSLRFNRNSVTMRTSITSNIPVYLQSLNNSGTTYFELNGNKILNPGQMGIYLNSCSNSGTGFNRIYNNMVGGNFRYATGTYGIYLTSCTRNQLYHNSVNMDIATTSGTNSCIFITSGSLNDVRNNHLAVTNPASVNAFNLYLSSSAVVTNVDYNNYYNLSTSSSLMYNGGPSYELYNYKAAFPNGGGLNSISINPNYVSLSDLHSSAPCNDAASIGVATDIDGQTRSSKPDIGADEVTGLGTNDIGVSEILSPVFPLSSGNNTIKVVIKNYGSNTVTSANVNYNINNSGVTTQSWTGSLATCDTAHVTFNTQYNFSTGANYIETYTTSPNGNTDSKRSNDSIKTSICTAMSGLYTINASGSGSTNYTSFKNAVDALICAGVSGPVTFSVAAGTYNERVVVPPINGTSTTNTIVFDGGNGNAGSRIITFATTSTALQVLQLKACNNITFRNLTIRSTSTSTAWVAHFLDGVNNRINNCVIDMTGTATTSTSSAFTAVVMNGSNSTISTQSFFGNNNILDSNTISFGYYNVYVAMNALTNTFITRNNTLNNSYLYGYFSNGNYSPIVSGNTLNLRTTTTSNYGIYFQNCNNTQGNFMTINANRIINAGIYGIYLTSCSKSGTDYNIISNNMVGNFRHTAGPAGIFLTSASRNLIYHNSIDLSSATLNTSNNAAIFIQNGSANEVRNNHLMVSNTTALNAYPLWITPTSAVAAVDYNNYFNLSSSYVLNLANNLITINSYKNAYPAGGGVNSSSVNPLFVSSTDLHSTNTCFTGQNLSSIITTDVDGESRSSTPDMGADEVNNLANNDMGVMKINSPKSPISAGTNTVNVTLRNYGSNTITSANINYILNGASPVTQSWTGSLAPCDTANFTFTTSANMSSGSNSLRVFTSNPNGASDPVNNNDTARFNLCGALNGTYTIGSSGNYPNFTAAVNALYCGGVSGKVTFNVASGNYYEQILINDLINGISATNNVTFQSASGNPNDVALVYNGTTAKNYTLNLNNSRFLQFRNMTISAINTSFSTALLLDNNASNDSFINVIFNGVTTTTNSTNFAVIRSPSGISNFIYFGKCTINNGAYGSYFLSNATAPSTENLTFDNCTFNNQYAFGVYNQNINGIKLIKNNINTNSTLTTYIGIHNNGILINSDANQPLIIGNLIYGAVSGTGLYNQAMGVNSTMNLNRRPIIANNMIQLGNNANACIGIRDNNTVAYSLYLHNSVNLGGTSTASTSAAGYFESSTTGNVLLNNSFAAYAGNPALRINTPTNYRSNYNNLFTTGANLAYQSTTARTTIALWKSNTLIDTNSINVNPMHSSNIDLHSNQSSMNNAGTPTSFVISDYDGNTRCPNAGCAGSTSNPDIGADEFVPVSFDAAINSINTPATICPGSSTINVTLRNAGSTTLTSASINWSVNGVAQTPFSWTGSLAQGISGTFNLGPFNFTSSNSTIKVWATNPNSNTDQNNMNDTAIRIPLFTLKGSFTIGGNNPDFRTFNEAATALNTRGVCGPVIFNVRQGTYGDRIQINSISGSSDINFITFRPDPSNTAPVELIVDGNSSANDNHTIFLNGTRFIAFREMRITNASLGNSSFGSVLRFAGTQDSVLFIKNIISGPVTTSTSTNFAVVNHGTGAANMINRFVLDSNTISNGSYGVYLYGNTNSSASTLEFRNRIRHNQINGAYYSGIQTYFQRRNDIIGNRIWLSPTSQTGSVGVYIDYVDSFRFERNNINNFGQYGLYLQRANFQFGGGSFKSTIQNNMIGGKSTQANPYGIYFSTSSPGCFHLNIYHNSISVTSGNTGSAVFLQQTSNNQFDYLDFQNNSFANFGNGSYVCYFYCSPVIPNLTINYNNYFNGSNNLIVIATGGYTNPTAGAPTYNNNSIGGNPGYFNNLNNLKAARTQLDNKGTNISSCLIDIENEVRPKSPSSIVDIGADEHNPVQLDISVTGLNAPSICTNTQPISIRVSNAAFKRIDSFRLNWSVNGVIQTPTYVTSTINSGNFVNATVTSSFNFTNNTDYNFSFWAFRPNGVNDSVPDNDTFKTVFSFLGNAQAPITYNNAQCGAGLSFLSGNAVLSSDSISWHTANVGGTTLGIGNKIVGPYINRTTTFYAQAIRFSKAIRFGPTGNTGVNITQTNPYGGMYNVTPSKNIYLDSVLFRLWYNVPNTGYKLFYKTGGFSGFETNSSAWTQLSSGAVTFFNQAGQNYGRVPTNGLFLTAGQQYSFYITTQVGGLYPTGNSLYSQSAGATVTNPDMTIQGGGSIIIGEFGSVQVLTNWHPEFSLVYKNQCNGGPRSPIVVTVKPRPTSIITQGTPFQGQFNFGLPANPDVAEVGKTNTYEITPPVGYNNADHGTTWAVTSIYANTKWGITVPMTEYDTVLPSANGPGLIMFKPNTFYLDSLITFTVNMSDFGPYNCDSTLKRTVMVAPTPKTNFVFGDTICLGTTTFFDNLTSIHSGDATYKWYFGTPNNDSSDNKNPDFNFPSAGAYNVRLVATSTPWGVVKDTTITVNIIDVPNVKFKVINQCEGIPVVFQNQTTVSGAGALQYSWNFGDNSPKSNVTSPSHLYNIPKSYPVTLSVNFNGCRVDLTKNAYQFPRPDAEFNLPSAPVCAKSEIDITDNSTIAWGEYGTYYTFGDGNFGTVEDVKHTYQNSGTYNIKLLTISEFGCADSITKQMTIKSKPTSDFTFPFACSITPTPFTNNSTIPAGESVNNYLWSFSDNTSSTLTNPSKSWSIIGPKTVKLKTVLNNGCEDEIIKTLNVGVQPTVVFEAEDQCVGKEVNFTNKTTYPQGNITYFWDFGDNTSTTQMHPNKTYSTGMGGGAATYNVKLVASIAGGCKDSMIKTISINPLPTSCDFDFRRDFSISKTAYVFTPLGTTTGINYVWYTGDGNAINSSATGMTYSFANQGKFCVEMVASNASGCECSKIKCVTVATGVNSVNGNNDLVTVYPNPNAGVFNIEIEGNTEKSEITIYNGLGVLIKTIENSEKTNLIDLSQYSSGVYMIKVNVGNKIITKTVTVSK